MNIFCRTGRHATISSRRISSQRTFDHNREGYDVREENRSQFREYRGFWKLKENRKAFFDRVYQKLNLRSSQDWYQVDVKKISQFGGDAMLSKYYKGSLGVALADIYPDHDWKPFLFSRTAKNYWANSSNQRKFMEDLKSHLDVGSWQDFEKISEDRISEFGGRGLYEYYDRSIPSLLRGIYPEHAWKTSIIPEHRRIFDRLRLELQVKDHEDWYKVNRNTLLEMGGTELPTILRDHYENSHQLALRAIYSEYDFKSWRSEHLHRFYWQDLTNQRTFMDDVRRKLNFETDDDWYSLSEREFEALGGEGILKHHGGSMERVLTIVYPEIAWEGQRFLRFRSELWTDSNSRGFFEDLARKLNINDFDDWYKVSKKTVREYGGGLVLDRFGNSHVRALQECFPEFHWKIWEFKHVTKGFWLAEKNQRSFMEHAHRTLGLEDMDDWYQVKNSQIASLGGSGLLAHYGGSIIEILKRLYPDHRWSSPTLRDLRGSKSQAQLFKVVQRWFPDEDVHMNVPLGNLSGDRPLLQLDIAIIRLKLSFEYQGEQHFDPNFFGSKLSTQSERDERKRKICHEEGFTLIEVPYWWNKDPASLLSKIVETRPDLIALLI